MKDLPSILGGSRKSSSRGEDIRFSTQEEVAAPVKVVKVTQIDQLSLTCEMCGTQMSQGKFVSNGINMENPEATEWWYEYTCSSCGHVHKSKRNYPCQRFHFNLDEFVMIQDDGQIL